MPAKPARSDRAPKSRWSTAERTTPEHSPRRRDGQKSGLPAAFSAPIQDAASRDFADLGVPDNLVAALGADGIAEPYPIQAATIPDALVGRDVLGRGRTGSGKTLAFGLPMITRLTGSSRPARAAAPRGLVLVPTRELAMQVADVIAPLTRIAGLSLVLVAGGMPYPPQILAFSRGVDIVVATPGRLIDLMDRGDADLSRIEITVLDEADHMADLGFLPAVSQILDAVPDNGQRLLFSATLDNAVDRLVRNYLHEPVTHQVDTGQASVPLMSHHLVSIAPQHKTAVTAEIASRPGRTLIFVRTQRGADRVAEQLRRSGVLAGALHGGLAQGARTRIMSAFKHGSLPVLVATDVAARGIHVDEVGLVLHADPPNGPKEYLHRAGRTARAGGTGTVVTFALPHQRHELGRLTTQAGVRPVMLSAIPGDRALAAATGARRASGNAISDAAYQRVIAPPPAQRSHAAHGRRGDGGVRGPARSGRRRAPGSTGARGSRSRHIPD
jgi:superfamily II DNA/RNA helicase